MCNNYANIASWDFLKNIILYVPIFEQFLSVFEQKRKKRPGELVPRTIYELAGKLADEKWISKEEKIEVEQWWKQITFP